MTRNDGSEAPTAPTNIVPFPHIRRSNVTACPHCGTLTDVWRFGRILWAYCERHELRWVVADYGQLPPAAVDRCQARRNLEFLAGFVEISRLPD